MRWHTVVLATAFIAVASLMLDRGSAATARGGQAIFASECGSCHASNGTGTGSVPPLDGNPHVTSSDSKILIANIVNGMSGPLTVNGITYNAMMPSWQTRLSNENVAAVTTYIRSAWSNRASAVSANDVTAAGAAVSMAIGRFLYNQVCAACHGLYGSAPGRKMLAGDIDITADDPSPVIRIIKRGVPGMPGWGGQLSNADIASVLTFLRSSWGNNGGEVTPAQVEAVK